MVVKPVLSLTEQRVLDFIPKDGSMITMQQLARASRYQQNYLTKIIRGLEKKTRRNRYIEFKVMRTAQKGPYPLDIWIEKRNNVRAR
jgi:DNA-binding MarR family transcriptional regulator